MGISKCHPITVKPLTVRGSQKNPFKIANFLPEEHSIYTKDISQDIGNGYMTKTKNILGGWEGKARRRWTSLMTVINNNFHRVIPQRQLWLVLVTFCPLTLPSFASYSSTHTVLTCMYDPKIFSSFLPSIYPEFLVPFPHSPAIELLMFIPVSPTLLLIPPNQ